MAQINPDVDPETPRPTQLDAAPAITRELAKQFALILSSGVPHLTAMSYIRPDLAGHPQKLELQRWLTSPTVQQAILAVQGKPWQDMGIEEKIKFAIDKSYTEMAYFLYANNYNDLSGHDRNKADTCRATLEAKLAGMAGKMDALTTFWNDVTAGRVTLAGQPAPMPGKGRPAAH